MSTEQKRQELLHKLSRGLVISVPVMAVAAVGITACGSTERTGADRGGYGYSQDAEATAEADEEMLVAMEEEEAGVEEEEEEEAVEEEEEEEEALMEEEEAAVEEEEEEEEAVEEDVDPEMVLRPEVYEPYEDDPEALVELGEQLFHDETLSGTGALSCATCHAGTAGYEESFAEDYPHRVEMAATDFGIDRIHLDEMVQLCMVAPMQAEPLDWESRDLAALVEYSKVEQARFREKISK